MGQRYKKFIPSLQFASNRIAEGALFAPLLLQRLESAALPTSLEEGSSQTSQIVEKSAISVSGPAEVDEQGRHMPTQFLML